MKPQLDHLAEIAKSCPAVQIEIHGHSASLNAAQTSRSLAEHRAQSAFGYLVAAGVDSKRLGTIGHGDREPAESAANDRVEFRLQDPTGNVAALRIMIDLAELLDQSTGPAVAGLEPLIPRTTPPTKYSDNRPGSPGRFHFVRNLAARRARSRCKSGQLLTATLWSAP